MIHATQLAAKVAARNRINTEANRLHPICLELYRPFLGKKIVNVTGTPTAAAAKVAPASDERSGGFTGFERILRASSYALRLHIRCLESYAGRTPDTSYAVYDEQAVSIGAVEHGVLTSLIETVLHHRTDWTAAEVIKIRELLAANEQERHDLEARLYGFGRYDQ